MDIHTRTNLKVVILLNRLFEWSQQFITRELLELQRQGVELHICAREIIPRDDLSEDEKTLLRHFTLIPENPFAPGFVWRQIKFAAKHPLRVAKAWLHFLSFGHKHPVKVIRSLVCLARALTLADTVLKKQVHLLHAQFMTAPTETALYLSVLTGVPFGCTAHAMDIYHDNSGMRKKLERTSYVITISEANVRYFIGRWAVDPGKLHLVYNSVAIENDFLQKRNHRPFTFLAAGRLVPKKGFAYLIRACHILKKQGMRFRCTIAGAGPLHEELIGMMKGLDLSEIIDFHGYASSAEMARLYSDSDVLVMPSIIDRDGDRDGLPTVCIEALSHGLPVICTDISGLPECVVENKNGKVVPQKDPGALADAMASLLQSEDPDFWRKNAVQFCSERFDAGKNVAQTKAIMQRHALDPQAPEFFQRNK